VAEERLGRFRLLERLAVGGTAEVFRARILGEGGERPAVVKRILPQHIRDPRFRGMFEQEARLLATLDHPNVVRLLDFGDVQGSLLLALEHVDGGDLGALLSGTRLAPPLAAHIALEVARALDYVHRRTDESGQPLHIIHRDVSPQNILLSTGGEVKLTDFGIAKSTQPRDRTATGVIKGKFAYLAPEQALPGSPTDARLDVFALGAVLYECLFGRPPFEGQSEVETLERLRLAELVLEDDWLPPEDRPLAPILRRCLAREPDDRQASAGALASELRRYLDLRPGPPPDRAAVAAWVAEARARLAASHGDDLVGQLLGQDSGPRTGTALFSQPAPNLPGQSRRGARVIAAAAVLLIGAGAVAVAVTHRGAGTAPLPLPPLANAPALPAPIAVAPAPIAAVVTPPPERPRPPREAVPPRKGRLVINSIPWANVFVDGERLGTTPLRHTVPAGNHRIVLKDGGGRTLRSFAARIGPGQERVFSFEEGGQ
jgi:tRNA A-37 threonylcarbamoyl transferase component Bud32